MFRNAASQVGPGLRIAAQLPESVEGCSADTKITIAHRHRKGYLTGQLIELLSHRAQLSGIDDSKPL